MKAQPVSRNHAATLIPFVGDNVQADATVYTDDAAAYAGLTTVLNQRAHEVINHGRGKYLRGKVHTAALRQRGQL